MLKGYLFIFILMISRRSRAPHVALRRKENLRHLRQPSAAAAAAAAAAAVAAAVAVAAAAVAPAAAAEAAHGCILQGIASATRRAGLIGKLLR